MRMNSLPDGTLWRKEQRYKDVHRSRQSTRQKELFASKAFYLKKEKRRKRRKKKGRRKGRKKYTQCWWAYHEKILNAYRIPSCSFCLLSLSWFPITRQWISQDGPINLCNISQCRFEETGDVFSPDRYTMKKCQEKFYKLHPCFGGCCSNLAFINKVPEWVSYSLILHKAFAVPSPAELRILMWKAWNDQRVKSVWW